MELTVCVRNVSCAGWQSSTSQSDEREPCAFLLLPTLQGPK